MWVIARGGCGSHGGRGCWGREARRRETRRSVWLWWGPRNAQTTTRGPNRSPWSLHTGTQMLTASQASPTGLPGPPPTTLSLKLYFYFVLNCSTSDLQSCQKAFLCLKKSQYSTWHWGFRTTALTDMNRLFRLNTVTLMKGSRGVQESSTSGGKDTGWTGKKRTPFWSQVLCDTESHWVSGLWKNNPCPKSFTTMACLCRKVLCKLWNSVLLF